VCFKVFFSFQKDFKKAELKGYLVMMGISPVNRQFLTSLNEILE